VKDKEKKKRIIILLSILFILVIPALLMIAMATWLGRTWQRPEGVEEEVIAHVVPSQILEDKMKYKDQFILARGQVVMDDAICERVTCPKEDPCCGCKDERELLMIDAGMSLLKGLPGKLPLMTPGAGSLCQRKTNSCDYQCPDWQPGGIYEIRGTFRANPPPRGSALNIFFGYYLEVEEKKLVGSVGMVERVRALITDLRNLVASYQTSGYYILH